MVVNAALLDAHKYKPDLCSSLLFVVSKFKLCKGKKVSKSQQSQYIETDHDLGKPAEPLFCLNIISLYFSFNFFLGVFFTACNTFITRYLSVYKDVVEFQTVNHMQRLLLLISFFNLHIKFRVYRLYP